MPITQFTVPLQGSPTDRYRHYHVLEKDVITAFTIQYEAEIDEQWREIVRYDTAHNRPHKDLLHPDGTTAKEEFPYYTNAEVLTFGQDDIRKNWKKYRAQYEKEMRMRK
ncbi:MAG: hypothetical protein HY868_13495 [Chloroflexi bacterium]|nr:hypothetical protein [Chloroflexota bacterium]